MVYKSIEIHFLCKINNLRVYIKKTLPLIDLKREIYAKRQKNTKNHGTPGNFIEPAKNAYTSY
jgi:hypothetical protein